MNKIQFPAVLRIISILLRFNGLFIILSALVSYIFNEEAFENMFWSGIVVILISLYGLFIPKENTKQLGKRDGYLIVALGWVVLTFSGSFPYLFTGYIPNFTDAVFESVSGFTTTGSSILNDIEILPKGLLFWRSMTHWLGGMGIIVLAVAILPLLGVGGMQLFVAEAPGPSADKLQPRIADTAKRLWLLYLALTTLETFLLRIAGMNWFDSVNHAMCTLSTGGFSTKNSSVAYWNDQPIIQYIIIAFMFIAGANFVLTYFALKGKVQKVIKNEEFRYYFLIVSLFTIISTVFIVLFADVSQSSINHPMVWGEWESAFRHSLFQVLAVITTTGFVTADFTLWTPFLTVLFFGMMFLGGSAGSTSGGVKFVRHIIMIKNGFMEYKRQLHPNAVIPVRFNGKAVKPKIVYNILAFFVIYMSFFILGALALALTGMDYVTAIGGAATALGNVGPGLGDVSPVDNFAGLTDAAKWIVSFLMVIGRLELFTFLIVLTPFFWSDRF
jgi:trk system potassium uptake protein TrkH